MQPRIYHIWKMNKDLSLVNQSNHFIIVTQFLRESKVRALFNKWYVFQISYLAKMNTCTL